jgi:3-hydroxyacyl-CoA dehydrogenase
MGARIAAHFANAGVPCHLLDVPPTKVAAAGLDAVIKSKPAAFFDASLARLITVGNFEDDLPRLAEVDWIVEAVVEDLAIKRALLKRVEAIRRPGSIITTNTSGLPIHKIADGFSADFRRSWFGTHFFNPPRYMRLLEIIPTEDTDRGLVDALAWFCDVRLGKGVVFAKDTPNFIANRLGVFSLLNIMRLMQQMDLSIEEVDALTGPLIGGPRSATFRTLDMVGLDVLSHVAKNMAAANVYVGVSPTQTTEVANRNTELPEFYQQMLRRNLLGDKSGGGFYKKNRNAEATGSDKILALDWKTLEYRPQQKPKFAALEIVKNVEDIGERIRNVLSSGTDTARKALHNNEQRAGKFLWSVLSDLWIYAASLIPEISDSIVDIDRAMRLGFNWELGPFELWDAAGFETTMARMKDESRPIAENAARLLTSHRKSWYPDDQKSASGRAYFDVVSAHHKPVQLLPGTWTVAAMKKTNGVVKKNPSASLVDIGDGIGCIEFHSKMNLIGGDIISLITQALRADGIGGNFDAFVISSDAVNFSAGANLVLLLLSAQEEEWDEIDLVIRQFQNMTQAIKFSPKPVVVAPFGLTLGGGCEMSLHAAARQPHAELYMGLVEAGVGLLPGGGGCKEMLLRAIDTASAARGQRGHAEAGLGAYNAAFINSVELMDTMKRTFETVAMAKVSTSALHAQSLGFLADSDDITMNRERVLADAKARALALLHVGYEPPARRTQIPAPGENILATLKMGAYLMHEGAYITEYELKLATKIAEVLCGGNETPGVAVSEQYLLDLEREAFKSLCGEPKTQERIRQTLKTGKPLRN